MPKQILRQNVNTAEVRAVATASLLEGIPSQAVPMDALGEHEESLRRGALPVGSVEFVREAMRHAGVEEPANLSYPPELQHHYGRRIRLGTAGEVAGQVFVKPLQTKLFTGFLFQEGLADADLSEEDREQLQVLRKLPPACPVWIAEPVNMVAEWRVYVRDGHVLGSARYDPDGPDDVPEPEGDWVAARVQEFASRSVRAYAMDIARLADGRLVICEVNDAWAIGLYGRALEPRAYLEFLCARWEQLMDTSFKRSGGM